MCQIFDLIPEKLLEHKNIDKIIDTWFLVCLDSIIRKPGDMRQMACLQRLGGSVPPTWSFFIADNDMNHLFWWSLRNSIAIISGKLLSLKKVIASNPASKPDSGPFYWYFKVIKIKQIRELFLVLGYIEQHSTFERCDQSLVVHKIFSAGQNYDCYSCISYCNVLDTIQILVSKNK